MSARMNASLDPDYLNIAGNENIVEELITKAREYKNQNPSESEFEIFLNNLTKPYIKKGLLFQKSVLKQVINNLKGK